MSGKFIVLEGGEGCGKTTQLVRLSQWLNQQDELLRAAKLSGSVVVTREPGGTALGQQLRQLLLAPPDLETMTDRAELLLYAADRAQHVESLLKPLLAQGTLILCDRYTDSTVAYQGYGRGLDLNLILQLNAIATGGLESDLTLWLDLEAEQGLVRAKQRQQTAAASLDRIEQGTLAFHQRVRQGFQALAQQHPERIVRIDASQPQAAVAAKIQAVVVHYLQLWS